MRLVASEARSAPVSRGSGRGALEATSVPSHRYADAATFISRRTASSSRSTSLGDDQCSAILDAA